MTHHQGINTAHMSRWGRQRFDNMNELGVGVASAPEQSRIEGGVYDDTQELHLLQPPHVTHEAIGAMAIGSAPEHVHAQNGAWEDRFAVRRSIPRQ